MNEQVNLEDLPQDLVEHNPEIMSGALVFRGTRVPAQSLFDYVGAGDSLDEFLDDFPSVTREQALNVLAWVHQKSEIKNQK